MPPNLASANAALARTLYERDGEIAPILRVIGQREILAHPTTGDAGTLAWLIRQLIWMAEAKEIILVNEAWVRSYEPEAIPDVVSRPRDCVDTDPLVHTGIVVDTYSATDVDDHLAIISTPHTDDAGHHQWEITELDEGDGGMPRIMRWIVEHPITTDTPDDVLMGLICDYVLERGIAASILVISD